ncbi:MAG: hypothetical protein ABH841_01825 [Candidatus Nealsonbacteria bacterium]
MFEKEPQFKMETAPEVKENPLDRLKGEIRDMSLGLQKEGIPVDDQARIDIKKFGDVYSKQTIESDGAWVKNFMVVRTSEYDDARYGVDTALIHRKTGQIVCGFDEVAAMTGARFEEKKSKVLERN